MCINCCFDSNNPIYQPSSHSSGETPFLSLKYLLNFFLPQIGNRFAKLNLLAHNLWLKDEEIFISISFYSCFSFA